MISSGTLRSAFEYGLPLPFYLFLLKRNSVCARCIVGKVIHGVSVPLATARPQRVTRASNVGPPACATSRMTRASNRRRNRRSLPSSSVERSTPPSQSTYVDAAFLHTPHAARNARVCCGHRCALPKRVNRSRCRSRHQETTHYVEVLQKCPVSWRWKIERSTRCESTCRRRVARPPAAGPGHVTCSLPRQRGPRDRR